MGSPADFLFFFIFNLRISGKYCKTNESFDNLCEHRVDNVVTLLHNILRKKKKFSRIFADFFATIIGIKKMNMWGNMI